MFNYSEENMNIQDLIEKLKNQKMIYVIGHSNIDIDSAVSSKIFSEILNKFGIRATYAVLEEKYNFDTYNQKMVDACMNFSPTIVKKDEIKEHIFFLVDHNDYLQSVGPEAKILGCIDHHPNSNRISSAIISDTCATALFIFKEFKKYYNFSDEQKFQIYMAFLNDSTFGKSSRYKESDEIIAKELGFKYDYNEMFRKYFIPTNLEQRIEDVLNNGLKSYKFGNIYFESGYVESFDTNRLKEYEEAIKKRENYLGIWIDYTNSKTYVIFNYIHKIKKWKYDFIASRATTILNDVLSYINIEN